MKRAILSSQLLAVCAAGLAVLGIAAFLLFTLSADRPDPDVPPGLAQLIPKDPAAESGDSARTWALVALAGAGLVILFSYFRRSTRKAYARNGVIAEAIQTRQPRDQAAADQLRDALAAFNRQEFESADAPDDLIPLYRAFVSARTESEKRNSRFMYDSVGAAHVQAAERMLTDMEQDLKRQWPGVHSALRRLPESPMEADLARFRADVDSEDYEAVSAYVHLLRTDVRKELVHAELRYRRLLGG